MRFGRVVGFDGRPGRDMDDLADAAAGAEADGFSTIWFPEHVVFVAGARSQYPYGTMDFGDRPGVYDPIVAMTVAARATTTIRLGTGVLILPQREPLTLAQQLVAVDHASDGRLDLGVGVGWLREEMEALGVPWERRGERADDHIEVLRKAWRDELVGHHSDFASFAGVQAWPKPVQRIADQPGIPIWVGGNTPRAVRRAARLGDGWFGWGLAPAEAASTITALRAECERIGRNPDELRYRMGHAGLRTTAEQDRYGDAMASLGVDEVVIVHRRSN